MALYRQAANNAGSVGMGDTMPPHTATELQAMDVYMYLVKQYNIVLESNRVCCSNSRQFVTSIRELSQHSKKDAMLMDCLEKFSSKLSGIIDAQMGLIESTQKSVKQQLQNFVKDDVKKFKDTKKEFDKSSEALEAAQNRNAQAPRNKVHEVEDASTALLNARKTFRCEALDYVLQMLALMEAQATFFAEGHDSLKQLENYRQQLAEQDISFDDSMVEFSTDAPNGIAMEGYLYKRASNAFKTWSRRWFSIQKNQLVYQKKLKDTVTVVVEDLRLCTVKSCPDLERRFCFEVVSPSKSCLLQADSEKQQQAWMLAVQNSIATAFQEQTEDLSISVRLGVSQSLLCLTLIYCTV
ncbi:ACAP3 protein, partial [Polypterus senegalus]